MGYRKTHKTKKIPPLLTRARAVFEWFIDLRISLRISLLISLLIYLERRFDEGIDRTAHISVLFEAYAELTE